MHTVEAGIDWIELTKKLSKTFAERASGYDIEGSFVAENYQDLKEHRYFAGLVPVELGGLGMSHSEMCNIIRIIGQGCGSTALAFSMHQHLVAATVWKYKRGQGGEAMLRNIAANQPTLVSTGARDWLESNGNMVKVDGGYHVSATKHFASQSAVGTMMITSAPFHHPDEGWQVLHFPIPFASEGVSLLNNWDTLGMRGTGSHSIKLDNVFVPDEAVVLARPQGEFHPVWNVVLTVAMPLIMSSYLGIAQRAAEIAVESVKKFPSRKPYQIASVGRMNNVLTTAELNWKDMVHIANNFSFEPLNESGHKILTRKTNVANAVISVVTQAMEIAGGSGFFRGKGLEQLFRDIQAAKYHPLQENEQIEFSGNHILQS